MVAPLVQTGQNNDPGIFDGFTEFFRDVGSSLGTLGTAIKPALPAIAGSLLSKEAYDRLSDIGTQSILGTTVGGQRIPGALELAERAQAESRFQPFTVTTPTGAMFTARAGQPGSMLPPVTTSPSAPPSMGLPPGMNVPGGTPGFDFTRGQMPLMYEDGGPTRSQLNALKKMAGQDAVIGGTPGFDFGDQAMGIVAVGLDPTAPPPAGLEEAIRRSQEQSDNMMPATPAGSGVNVSMDLSPREQELSRGLFGGAGDFFSRALTPTEQREAQIFERMRAVQRPEEERQRLALEERLAAQGRLGTSSAAYGGGTPELLAMSRAQEEARNTAMLNAMQQAQVEQAQQASLGGQLLGASYLPQAEMVSALTPALRQQELAQAAQQFGTGLFGETAMSGLEARLLAEQARANLLGGIGSSILQGQFTPQYDSSGNVLFEGLDLGDIAGNIGSGLTGLFNSIFRR